LIYKVGVFPFDDKDVPLLRVLRAFFGSRSAGRPHMPSNQTGRRIPNGAATRHGRDPWQPIGWCVQDS